MSNQQAILFNPKNVKITNPARLLGRQLIEDGHITTTDLVHGLEQQSKMDAQLGDILVINGTLSSEALFATLATQSNTQHVDLNNDPYHVSLSNILSAQICLKHQVLAWLRMGNSVLVATSHPDKFDALRAEMQEAPFTFLPVIADPRQIQSQLTRLCGEQLAEQALVQVPDHESCRNWGQANLLKSRKVVLGAVAVLSTIVSFPRCGTLDCHALGCINPVAHNHYQRRGVPCPHYRPIAPSCPHAQKRQCAAALCLSYAPPISRTRNCRCADQTTGKFHISQTTSGYCSGP